MRFVDDVASQAVVILWRGSDLGQELVGRHFWQNHTKKFSSTLQCSIGNTYVFLLLMYMPDLKPYVFLGQGSRRIGDNIFKALW